MPSAPPQPTAAQRETVSQALAATALALLLGLQPITTDVYLPALPALMRDLAATVGATQLTMAALMLAFGVAQLFWGPVADRLGRRPVLLIGLALYTATSIAGALAPDIGTLIACRALQGAALAAAVVVARALLRDLYEPRQGAHVMSLALSGLGVIAVLCPTLGGAVAAAGGWRAALGVVAFAGAATLAFIAWRLPETIGRRNPAATRLAPLLATWHQVARHPTFVAWTLLISCSYGGLFTTLAGSAFIYIDVLKVSPSDCGLLMGSVSVAYLLGTFACRRLIARHGVAGAVRRGAFITLAGGAAMALLAAAGVQAVWAILLPQWLFSFAHGIHQPCGQAGCVGPFPHAAGAASALAGFVLSLLAFGIGLWLGVALDGTTRPFAFGIGWWSLLTALIAWTLVQRQARAA
jgi:DHA1 family bicyclomycin/chloramphenicol resistance-like MFS transporter